MSSIFKRAFNIKKKLPKRRSAIISDESWFREVKYRDEDLLKIVMDIPEIRGALAVITNAVIGSYKFTTVETSDKEAESKTIKFLTDWVSDPNFKFESFLRKYMYSLLLRDMGFVELRHPKVDEEEVPWMYVMNPMCCNLTYTENKSAVTGMKYTPISGKPVEFDLDGFIYSSMDNFDGSEEGSPPLLALMSDINIYTAAKNYIKTLYRTGGVGRQLLVMEDGSADDFAGMVEDLKNMKGSSLALYGVIKNYNLSQNPESMKYKDVRDQFVQAVMSLLQIPPILMSRPGQSFKETSKSEMNAFASKVRAYQRNVENMMNQAVNKLWKGMYTNHKFELQPWVDPISQSAIHKVYTEIGVYTVNDIRTQLGLPPVEWGTIPFNFNLWPQIAHYYDDKIEAPSDLNPTTPTVSEKEEVKKFMERLKEIDKSIFEEWYKEDVNTRGRDK